jgi:hypothetical protein
VKACQLRAHNHTKHLPQRHFQSPGHKGSKCWHSFCKQPLAHHTYECCHQHQGQQPHCKSIPRLPRLHPGLTRSTSSGASTKVSAQVPDLTVANSGTLNAKHNQQRQLPPPRWTGPIREAKPAQHPGRACRQQNCKASGTGCAAASQWPAPRHMARMRSEAAAQQLGTVSQLLTIRGGG